MANEQQQSEQRRERFKENLHMTFLSIAILSFTIGIVVNYYTLKRLNSKG
jgi:predicted negative regulator of RcsB-dependent stress response